MAGLTAFGTLIKIGDGNISPGPEVFATLGEVRDISGPGLSMDAIESTSHTTTGGFRDRVAGLLDAGEVSFDINWDPNNVTHEALRADMLARVRRNFQVVFPSSPTETWNFAALITSYEIGAPVDGILTASITLTMLGAPTFA